LKGIEEDMTWGIVFTFCTVAVTAIIICFVHLFFIKSHIVDLHYDSCFCESLEWLDIILVTLVSAALWTLTAYRVSKCWEASRYWVTGTTIVAVSLSVMVLLIDVIFQTVKHYADRRSLEETDAALAKTNSKSQLEFLDEPQPTGFLCCGGTTRPVRTNLPPASAEPPKTGKTSKSTSSAAKAAPSPGKPTTGGSRSKEPANKPKETTGTKKDDDSEAAHGRYIKTRNRNSISQYV